MAGVDVKLGVSGLDNFKKNLNDAKAAVSAWDAALGLNKATLKNLGDQEAYANTQAYLLTQQIESQKSVVGQLQMALIQMEANGVSKSSKAFQKLREESYTAQTKLMDMQTELKGIKEGGSGAADGLTKTDQAVGNINKNVAWQNVSKGIGDIAKNLERGAKAAINFGKKVLSSVKEASGWADDLKTMSLQTGFSVEELQKMDKVAEIVDTDVDAIVNAQKKMRKAATTEGGIKTLEETLGIKLTGQSPEELFWEIGDSLMHMGDEFDKEAAAQKMFGASWRNLLPLFTLGKQGYEDLLNSQTVLTEDQVEKLAKADDTIKQMEQEVEQLKRQFWSENADNITKLMSWLIENKDKVKTALEVIAGGFALLKLGELATNMTSVVNGLKTLGLGGGSQAAAAATGAGGASAPFAQNAINWMKGLGVKAGSFMSAGGGTLLGVLGAGLLPGILATNSAYANSNATMARRLGTASGSTSMEAMFLAQAAQALNIDWGKNQDFASVEKLLTGMGARSDLEKAKLHNLLNGSTTSQGNYTWNELQRLWSGEEMDIGRMVAILESVTDAYERLVATQEQQNGDAQNQQNTLTSADIAAFTGLPGQIAQAVRAGVSGITITISQGAVDTIGQRNGQTMWQNIINKITGN